MTTQTERPGAPNYDKTWTAEDHETLRQHPDNEEAMRVLGRTLEAVRTSRFWTEPDRLVKFLAAPTVRRDALAAMPPETLLVLAADVNREMTRRVG